MTNKERIQEKISKLTNINSAYETQVSDMTVTNVCYFIDRLEDFLEDDEMAKAVDISSCAYCSAVMAVVALIVCLSYHQAPSRV